MLKKTITYTDFNGTERTEDYYFNLSKAELLEMEVGTTGGYAEKVQAIIDAKDSPDNGRPLAIAFEQTPAYSEIFMELATDADAGAAFINGILPADLIKEANKAALPKVVK